MSDEQLMITTFTKAYNKYIVTDCGVWAKNDTRRGCAGRSAPKATGVSVVKEKSPQRAPRVA